MICPCCNTPKPVLIVPEIRAGRYVLVTRSNLARVPNDAICIRCYDSPPR